MSHQDPLGQVMPTFGTRVGSYHSSPSRPDSLITHEVPRAEKWKNGTKRCFPRADLSARMEPNVACPSLMYQLARKRMRAVKRAESWTIAQRLICSGTILLPSHILFNKSVIPSHWKKTVFQIVLYQRVLVGTIQFSSVQFSQYKTRNDIKPLSTLVILLKRIMSVIKSLPYIVLQDRRRTNTTWTTF